MKEQLNNLIDILQVLCEKNMIIDLKELQEERDNLCDLVTANAALVSLINELIESDKQNRDEIMEKVILIRMELIDIIWHYEQLCNLTTKFIQRY